MKFLVHPIESLESRTLLSAGQLDPTFSGDGRFTAGIPGNITITDGTAQSDGKILAAGTIDGPSGKDLFVARVTADGALDTSFSGDGIATVSIGTADALDANIALDASGRIILAGGTENSASVVRLLSNGSLDPSFSGDGITTITTPGGSGDDVAIQSDGKIVSLVGYGTLFRLTTSGDLDTTYGNNGFASMPSSVGGTALAIGPSDKAVVVGFGEAPGRTSWDGIARFNSDGTLDSSFNYDSSLGEDASGGPGYAITVIAYGYDDNGLSDVAVGLDSSIYVTGLTSTEPSLFTVGKFSADGKLQWSDYAINDPFSTSLGQRIALQPDGKVIVGVDGFAYEGPPGDLSDFVLLRYNPDGTRDASFGQAGTVHTDFTDFKNQDLFDTPSSDVLAGIAVVGGNYIAIGGTSIQSFETPEGPIEIARYDGGNTPYVSPVTTLSDGSIQVVGTDGADQIVSSDHDGWKVNSNAININGEVLLFPSDPNTSLRINSYGGDDYIQVREPFKPLDVQIDAGADNDIVYSSASASTIYGGDGNDYLNSRGGGSSTIYGGVGQDTLAGSDNADSLFGEGGNDYLLGNGGDDHLDGGGGNDSAFGMGGNDQLIGGSGNDRLEGGADEDVLEGQSGNDSLYGNAGQDALSGGSDNDLLDGGTGPDYIAGDDGEDTVSYAARNNPVSVSLDDLPNDGESGEQDNVRSSVEDIVGGAGNDTLTGSSANNRIYGLAGDDVIHLAGGNDYAEGGAGNDFIDGGAGTDTLYGNSGDDTLQGDNSADVLDGGTGNNTINKGGTSGAPSPVVLGDDGTLSITGTSGPDELTLKQDYRGPVNVILNGATFTFDTAKVKAIVAHLGGGNDHVVNQATANQLAEGPAAYTVVLWGEGGDDVFEFPFLGNDFDVTNDTAYGGSGNDRFEIDAGHSPVLFGESGDDTVHSLADDATATVDGGSGIDTEDYRERLLDVHDVYVGANVENYYDGNTVGHFIHGNDLANHIIGTNENDTIDGGGGNDTIEGLQGDDSIIGGIGADRIDGGEGDDFISGGGGNDDAVGGIGADIIQGNAGNDTLDGQGGNDAVFGGSGDDTVSGGGNNDYLEGDDGNDHVIGNSGDDSLRGGTGDDILEGDSGNDTLLGEDGVDALFGGSGNDNLDGGANRDYLEGNTGQDTLFGGGGNDTFRARDNEIDTVDGGLGSDTAQVDNSASVKDDVLNIENFIA